MKLLFRITLVFTISAFIAQNGIAQQSCVFLPDSALSVPKYDRPKAAIHKVKRNPVPQALSILDSPPDFPNIDVTRYYLADQDEPSIAINPANPDNIIIGTNDYHEPNTDMYHYQSFDGGHTWSYGPIDPNWPFAAYPTDPSIAFNTSGEAFYSYGRAMHNGGIPPNDVVVNRSTNGGKDWDTTVRVIYNTFDQFTAKAFADKYYLAIDNVNGSPFKDRIYVTWVQYDTLHTNRVELSYSSDKGKHWSAPAFVSGIGKQQSPIPAIGSLGQVYVAYEDLDHHEIRLATSDDGGKTFPSNKSIAGYTDLGPLYPPGDPGAHPSIKGFLRVNSFPSIALDHSQIHHGRIYITWTAMGADMRHHIYLTSSDNIGNTWSIPKPIENDPSAIATDKFFPWIAVDDISGDVGIACYDSREDTSNVLTDLYMFFSKDGGQSFSSRRISGKSFDVRNNSSIGTSPPYFFGDYISLAADHNVWRPAWTDSREGIDHDADQEIFTSIVLPRAPSAPYPFIVREDSLTHFPDLSWEHSGLTTFGESLGDYIFRLKRSDGNLQIDLPKSARTFNDIQAQKDAEYDYTLQVITSANDTSSSSTVHFSSHANKEPLPPVITAAKAMTGSMIFHYRLPAKNAAGAGLTNLKKVFFLVDGVVIDSLFLTDASIGTESDRFLSFGSDGYHNIQLAALTEQSDGQRILSQLSAPAWLYSGAPLASYNEDFTDSKKIFTPFAWDTTNAGGKLPYEFINDSLPDVNYQNDLNSWFLLPPVTISNDAHTLEFIHEALVASGDSALVEVSTDDGVSFTMIGSYDLKNHPSDWSSSLALSKPVHDVHGLIHLMGKDAIIRFRLITHSSNGDGWFIDSIRFTPFMSVKNTYSDIDIYHIRLSENPVRAGSKARIELSADKSIFLTVNIYSVLGTKEETLFSDKQLSAGNFELEFIPIKTGSYFYEAIARSGNKELRRYGKFIVVP
jgi:hypothetical protein